MNILMFTIGYPPRITGGTETYVQGLVEALKNRGHECHVAYVEPCDATECADIRVIERSEEGIPIHVIQVNREAHRLERLVFDVRLRERMVEAVLSLVARVDPAVAHFHPLQLGLESHLIERIRGTGRPAVLTYHSTTTSCLHGDLIWMGHSVCDGAIIPRRCIQCFYHSKGVPRPAAGFLALLPRWFFRSGCSLLRGLPFAKKLHSFVSIPLLFEEHQKSWRRATAAASAIVAVCHWVRDVIRINGVPMEKVLVSRHGLRLREQPSADWRPPQRVTFGFLGRIHPDKGIPILLEAFRRIPASIPCALEFCSATFANQKRGAAEEALVRSVQAAAQRDPRIVIRGAPPVAALSQILAGWDALVLPSLWLESGPMVAYEAFSAQTPIIGSRRGGIAELVDDGRTGFLFAPGDAGELGLLLRQCAETPAKLRALRKNIPPQRTFGDVAAEMEKIYGEVVATK